AIQRAAAAQCLVLVFRACMVDSGGFGRVLGLRHLGADQQSGRAGQSAKQRGSPTSSISINRGLQHFQFSDIRLFSAGSKYLWLCTINAAATRPRSVAREKPTLVDRGKRYLVEQFLQNKSVPNPQPTCLPHVFDRKL